MYFITCQLNQFKMDDTIADFQEKQLYFSYSVTSALRHSLQEIKIKLTRELGEADARKIIESAAFVVLEQNLAEYVHNTIDATLAHSIPLLTQEIHIQIPATLHKKNKVKIRYMDTAGGFSRKFMEGKSLIDYDVDKLQDKRIFVETDKKSTNDCKFLGGCGFALSQTCRFLKKNGGTLKLKNNDRGAVLIFTSPERPQNRKPSFNNFKNGDSPYEEHSVDFYAPQKKITLSISIPRKKTAISFLEIPTPENAPSTDSTGTSSSPLFGFFSPLNKIKALNSPLRCNLDH